jgi:hypothetical protein
MPPPFLGLSPPQADGDKYLAVQTLLKYWSPAASFPPEPPAPSVTAYGAVPMALSAGLWGNQDAIVKPFKPANLQPLESYNISRGYALYTGTSPGVRACRRRSSVAAAAHCGAGQARHHRARSRVGINYHSRCGVRRLLWALIFSRGVRRLLAPSHRSTPPPLQTFSGGDANAVVSGVADLVTFFGTNAFTHDTTAAGMVYRPEAAPVPVGGMFSGSGAFADLLVENMGRINYGHGMDDDHKGWTGLTIGGFGFSEWMGGRGCGGLAGGPANNFPRTRSRFKQNRRTKRAW